jgi:hypothetical protein
MKNMKDYNTQDLSIVALQARLQRDQRLLKRCYELLNIWEFENGNAGDMHKALMKDLSLVLQEWEK